MIRENLVLGARQVILIHLADRLEQTRAELVVKIFRKQVFRLGSETASNVPRKIRMTVALRQIMNDQARARVRGVRLSRQVCSNTVC